MSTSPGIAACVYCYRSVGVPRLAGEVSRPVARAARSQRRNRSPGLDHCPPKVREGSAAGQRGDKRTHGRSSLGADGFVRFHCSDGVDRQAGGVCGFLGGQLCAVASGEQLLT